MSDQETITDIIAAKRREADSIEQSARGSFKAGHTWDDLPFTEVDLERLLDNAALICNEADRLEAALKCEKAAIETTNEMLRKALSGIAENLRIHLQLPTQTISMNRQEVECMTNDCEKALGKEGGAK